MEVTNSVRPNAEQMAVKPTAYTVQPFPNYCRNLVAAPCAPHVAVAAARS
jgi:hypothetical protein